MSKHWQIEDVKERPEEFLDAAQQHGAQYVTENGVATAVLFPLDPPQIIDGQPKYADIKSWLLAPEGRTETSCLRVEDSACESSRTSINSPCTFSTRMSFRNSGAPDRTVQ